MDPTQRVRLGRTDLEVTRLGLGTAPLGGMFEAVSDLDAEQTVRRAYEIGWRHFDTAPLYGYGMAETRLAGALASLPRDGVVLATKVGRLLRPATPSDRLGPGESIFEDAPPNVPSFDFTADGVRRSLRASLERLRVERVDIVHVHDPDDHYEDAMSGAFPALAQLRADGVIAAVGAGMNQTEMLCRFADEADVDCFLVAGRYSLLDPSAADALLDLCAKHEIGVICGGVYNSGVLASGSHYDYAPVTSAIADRVSRIASVCARHDVPLKAAAIQFPLGHPAVTCVVVGARTGAEVDENDAMFRFEIPPVFWEDVRRDGLIADHVPTPED